MRMWRKREPLYTAGENVSWYSHSVKHCGGSSKIKNRTVIWYSNSTSGYLVKGNKNTNLKGGEGNGTPLQYSFAWKIPWTEEPGRLQSMGSLRVRHDWATPLSLFTFMHWRRKWQPTPVFFAWRIPWWASIYGVAQSRTRLKRLSSSSSSSSSFPGIFLQK